MQIEIKCPYCGYENVTIEITSEWTEERSNGVFKVKGSLVYCFSCNKISEYELKHQVNRSEL